VSLRGVITFAAVRLLGAQTARLHRLDQRRRFLDFKRRWASVPQSEFSYEERPRFYRQIHDEYLAGKPMDYLEFGCWRGESMRAWSAINQHPDSRFFGFDSFEGLPEQWGAGNPKGTFSVAGQLPVINDPRVQFIKGWFQQSLPGFLRAYEPRARQVLHLDADLYSSTLFVLVSLNPPSGSILFFDEFADEMHEFRAFEDFLAACGREYRVIAARRDFHKLAIELL